MPKPDDKTEFDFDNMTVLQNVNLSDEDAFNFQDKSDDDDEPDDDNDDEDNSSKDDDNDDNDEDDEHDERSSKSKKPNKKNTSSSQRKPITSVDLTDDMVLEGLKKASGKWKDEGVDENDENDETDDKDDKDDKPLKNKKPAQGVTKDYKNAFEAHYNMMVDAGVWEPVKDFDGSREMYDKVIESESKRNIDAGLDEYLDDAFEKNPDGKVLGMKLLKHLANGGKVSTFQTLQAPLELDFEALDNDDEEVALTAGEEIIRSYLQEDGWEKDDINKRINSLKKLGTIVEEAKMIEKPYKKKAVARSQQHTAALEQNNQRNKENARKLNTGVMGLISNNHAFGNLKVAANKKEQLEIQDYIFTPGEKGSTEFRNELIENLQDPEFLLFTAVAMRKKLHKNPALLGGSKEKAKNEAKDELEEKLNAALLNKSLDSKGVRTGNEGAGGSSRTKQKFNMDEAVVIG